MGRKKSSSNNHGMRGQHPEYREILAELTSRHRQLSDGEGFEVVRRQEEVELLLRSGRYEEAHAAAVSLLQERPDFLPAANNLSLLQWILGNPEAAIETASRVLSLDGANLHALANLSRFLSSEGKKEEALEYGGRLKGVPPSSFLETYKKMEGLAFLGDDRGVADLFENAEEEPVFRDEWYAALFHHLAATAYCRLARESTARRCWKKALSCHSSLLPARQNLEDLEKPPGERNGPWYFGFRDWLPLRLGERLSSLADELEDGARQVRRRIVDFIRQHPVAIRVMIPLAQMGDPLGREYCLRLAEFVEDGEVLATLRDFALGANGTDRVRLEMVRVLQQKGVLRPGLVRMHQGGESLEVFSAEVEIYGEPQSDVGAPAQHLINQGHPLLRRGEGARAEEFFRRALALEPGQPAILQNLAVSVGMQGRREEARALFYQIHRDHPDYLFARTSVAVQEAQEGNLKRAYQLVWPLFQRTRFHLSEFATLCGTMVEILVLEGRRKNARHWIDLLGRVVPGHASIPHLKAIAELEE